MTLLVICTCTLQIFLNKNSGQNTFSKHVYIRVWSEQNNLAFRSGCSLQRIGSRHSLCNEIMQKGISIHGNRAMALLASSPTQIPRLFCFLLRVTRAAEGRCPAPRRAAEHGIWSNDFGESFIMQQGQNITRHYKTPTRQFSLSKSCLWKFKSYFMKHLEQLRVRYYRGICLRDWGRPRYNSEYAMC